MMLRSALVSCLALTAACAMGSSGDLAAKAKNSIAAGVEASDLGSYCGDISSCDGSTVADCEDMYWSVADDAAAADCLDAYAAFVACSSSKGSCVEGAWDNGAEECATESDALFVACLGG
ncbi:MAG: hypothetical protein H6732_02425 [Alphaproteobacteria bacterium]|nr:hypothetical protein [Alphaproteobacteria bacterium]